MNKNVPAHYVMEIAVHHNEMEAVRLAVESANQFAMDNYGGNDGEGDPCFISILMSGKVLVPIRKDIVGNLLVYTRMGGHAASMPNFLATLMIVLGMNGIKASECVSA